jgi:hypothetical protein
VQGEVSTTNSKRKKQEKTPEEIYPNPVEKAVVVTASLM